MPIIDGGPPAPPEDQPVEQRLSNIEKATGGTLPGLMSLALAQSSLPEHQIARASTTLARYFDLPPQWFFNDLGLRIPGPRGAPMHLFADPESGQAITLATARRLLRAHEDEVIARMLQEALVKPIPLGPGRGVVGYEQINAKRVAQTVRAMAPLRGEDLPFNVAFAMAVDMASSDINIDAFGANLAVTSQLQGLTPILAAEIARRGAAAHQVFQSAYDVASFVAPGAAGGIQAAKVGPTAEQVAAKRAEVAAAAASGKPIPATLEEVGGAPAEAVLGRELVGGLTMPGDFIASLKEAETNYVKAGEQIAEAIKIPFSDSWAGKAVGSLLDYSFRPLDAAWRVVSDPNVVLAPFGHEESATGRYNIEEGLKDSWDIIRGRTTAMEELQRDIGAPPWLTMTAQLFVGFGRFSLDPVQQVFNLASRARGAKLIAGLAEAGKPEQWGTRVEAFLNKPVKRIGSFHDVTVSQYLIREASRAEDPARYFARAVDNFRAYFGSEGIHPLVAERIWRFVRSAKKVGMSDADVERGVQSVLLAALGVKPPPNSLAAQIWRHVEDIRATTSEQLPLFLQDGAKYEARTTRLSHEAASALGALNDSYMDLATRGPRMLEIPHVAGPVTRAEHALRMSGLADTGLGKAIRSTLAMSPKVQGAHLEIGIEQGAEGVKDFQRALIRAQVFTPDELATARLQLTHAMRPENPIREVEFVKVVDRYNQQMLRRISESYGLTDVQTEQIMARLEDKLGKGTAGRPRVFAAFREGVSETLVREPILPSQAVNAWQIVDPVIFRRGIAETIGTWRKWRAAHYRAFGITPPAAPRRVVVPVRAFVDESMDLLVRDLFLSWFKPLVVLRPAYVLRVVGLEEQSRFLATLGLARRLESGKILTGARLAEMEGLPGAVGRRLAAAGESTIDIDVLEGAAPAMMPSTKVLGPDNLPLRVYHGTPNEFERFDPQLAREGLYGPGLYFAEDPAIASRYAAQAGRVGPAPTMDEIRRYFAPGKVVSSYGGGRDRVVRFLEDPTRPGDWSVEVEALDAPGGLERTRIHFTAPGHAQLVQAGIRHEAAPNVRIAYLDIRKPFDTTKRLSYDEAMHIVDRLPEPDAIRRFLPGPDDWKLTGRQFYDRLRKDWFEGAAEQLNQALREAGYDGIFHIGGQDRRVWIAFDEKQVAHGFENVVGGPITSELSMKFPRPGFLPDEALANTLTSRFAMATPGPIERAIRESLSPDAWGAIERGSPHFYDWWYNALAHQFGLDPVGRRYLDDVARGVPEEESVRRGIEFLTSPGDGLRFAKRIMGPEYTREALELQIRRGVRYARDLTGEHPNLAAAARDGVLEPAMLRAVPKGEQPILVHGPMVSESVLARVGPLKRGRDFVARWIVQEPTNRLSRQPYFKAWYDRIHRSLIETARAQGVTITPELLQGFHDSAREFAIGQVRRIMFDFTREGRIDQLTRYFLMFVQPFLEFPVVWGRIIRQNPATLWHFARLGRFALQSGFLEKDPETGELSVPLSWWAGAAPLLAAVTGGRLSPVGEGGGWQLSVPLTSFNLFAQSTFQLPLGGIAGELPIPMPAVNPEAMFALQRLISATPLRSDIKSRISSWLFQYGPVDPSSPGNLLPAYLHHGLAAIMPEWFESEVNLQASHFLLVQQAMGLEPDPDLAMAQARKFAGLRAFFAAIFPGAPRIDFPTAELEQEWRSYVEQGPDYSTARERFLEAHPGLDLIVIARTMWAEENPSPIPIPASQAVSQLLNTKGAKEFAAKHPAWTWAIIPSELRDGTLDPGSFFAQIASGQRKVLTPEQFLAKADVQRGWDAYFALRESWVAWTEAHPEIGEGDPSYDEEYADFAAARDHIGETNPAWAAEYRTFELGGVEPRVMAEARNLAKDELFTQTQVGHWLVDYFTLRDKTAADMAKAGIHSIRTKTAERLGITKRYDSGVETLNETYPDGATAYRLFFSRDLEHQLTPGDRKLNAIPEETFDQRITPWWTQFEILRDGPNQAPTEGARNEAFNAIRAYVELAYHNFSAKENPLILRWATADPTWQQDYLVSLVGRPYAYLNRFDKTYLLKNPTNDATEKLWTTYAQARGLIAEREATDPDFSSTHAYEALGLWVAMMATKNKAFAAQVAGANQWGYQFGRILERPDTARALFGSPPKYSMPYWRAFLDAVGEVQRVVDATKLGGSFDSRAKVTYNVLRAELLHYVDTLKEASVEFSQQWGFLEEASGTDPLISYFMPEFNNYFGPIQGYPGGPR